VDLSYDRLLMMMISRNIKIKICKPITFSACLYGTETWSLALKKVHGLMRVLRMVLGPKTEEATGKWK
jgi:hypothetical protein